MRKFCLRFGYIAPKREKLDLFVQLKLVIHLTVNKTSKMLRGPYLRIQKLVLACRIGEAIAFTQQLLPFQSCYQSDQISTIRKTYFHCHIKTLIHTI